MPTARHFKLGIDVGGTFTDFVAAESGGATVVHKVLSTPHDPSIAVLQGLAELAGLVAPAMPAAQFLAGIDVIVHGTTVTTNATLTRRGAKTGLLTTEGVRDALEMRRGIREKRYDNRYTNVTPLVPRYLRLGVRERLDRRGGVVTPLDLGDVARAIDALAAEQVEAVAICFMNAFANPEHEQAAARLVRERLPRAFLSVSSELLPSIRFYDRISTTALNAYVGPILDKYLSGLQRRLQEAGFGGVLLIMQSNGGVMSPEIARLQPALTLLSGPAGGPGAGLEAARPHGHDGCIVVDMGGTSFEASLVTGSPVVTSEGEIDRLRCALPMLDIHTIGAGGGSIGWLDAGGLLRMGPQSAGAAPGPACYGQGGTLPTTTDANLVLGLLSPDYFAGGRMRLDVTAARRAIEEHIAKPLGMTVEQAAAGMYRVACTNMAEGVREVTIKRGRDPREFPLIVAGGAGPLHSCLIAADLDIGLQIVPRESSVLCAAGMLASDLRHNFVRTFIGRFPDIDWARLGSVIAALQADGEKMLAEENVPAARREHRIRLDCRYLKQYHEVSVDVPREAIAGHDTDTILAAFHAEHMRLYGYELCLERTPVEIINVRVECVGRTERTPPPTARLAGPDASAALKGSRRAWVMESDAFAQLPVYDGHRLESGNRVSGPALVESETTTTYVSAAYDAVMDEQGALVVHPKSNAKAVEPRHA